MILRPRKPSISTQNTSADRLQRPCTANAAALHKAGATPSFPSSPAACSAALARARVRLDAVARAERLVATGMPRADADAQVAKAAGVSPHTLRRWRLSCRGLVAEARLGALIDRPGRGRCGPLSDGEMRDCVEALIYEHGSHLIARHVERALEARYGKAPSRRALQRWLKAWRADPARARALSAVSDPDGHRSRKGPALGDRGAGIDAPNALWELDSTPADVLCTDGRHVIVGAIDVWPRRAKVLVVPVSRAVAICALLRRCLIDWGVAQTVRTDEGKDYTSKHLARVLADLGIVHDICPPYTPEAKPFIERFFGTLTRDLFAHLPGFAGHGVADRKTIEAKKSFAQRRGRQERETFDIRLTGAELQKKCDQWCDAVYGRREHGATGQSPFARMARWPGDKNAPLRMISDPRLLDALLAEPAVEGGRRTIGKNGISVQWVNYIAPQMGERVGERVEVRLDPADPARLFVFALDGAFLFMAEDPERSGADRAAIASHAKASARKADGKSRRHARALKKQHRPERAMDDVLEAAEREASNVIVLPRPGEPHETPALKQAERAAHARDACSPDKADLLRRIEARRVEFELSHGDIALLASNALGLRVTSPTAALPPCGHGVAVPALKQLSLASLEALLDLLDNGVTWTGPAEASPAGSPPLATPFQEGGEAAVDAGSHANRGDRGKPGGFPAVGDAVPGRAGKPARSPTGDFSAAHSSPVMAAGQPRSGGAGVRTGQNSALMNALKKLYLEEE